MSARSAAVILQTFGRPTWRQALNSCLEQTVKPHVVVAVDTPNPPEPLAYLQNANGVSVMHMPTETGLNSYAGHRIYAALPHLVDEPVVMFLDDDNWFEPNHVESVLATLGNPSLSWCFAERRIVDPDGSYVCDDVVENGRQFVDTNCYAIRTELARKVGHVQSVSTWGQDRILYSALRSWPHAGTGRATVNYRLKANDPRRAWYLGAA